MVLHGYIRCNRPILSYGKRAFPYSLSLRWRCDNYVNITSQKRFEHANAFRPLEHDFYRETFICSNPDNVVSASTIAQFSNRPFSPRFTTTLLCLIQNQKQGDVFASFNPPSWTTPSDETKSSDLVLLLTKRFAHWLSNDDSFLRRALEHTWGPSNPQDRLCCVVAAVVDRIPAPCMGDIQQLGFEGFAICASDKLPLLGRHGKQIGVSRNSDNSRWTEAQGRLSFNFFSKYSATNGYIRPTFSVTLALANTVFQTGQRSTLQLSQWTRDARGFHLLEKKERAHHEKILNLPAQGGYGFKSPALSGRREDERRSFTMFTPLMPLVPLRQVAESTGNVISKIIKVGEENPMTASQELEPAISQMSFRSRYTSIEEVAVWALVIPEYLASRHKNNLRTSNVTEEVMMAPKRETSKFSDYSSSIPLNLIWEGARLHRVLSGGGGWGQKEGLISLDPGTTFESNSSLRALDMNATASENGESFFARVAKPGDLIGFYVGPHPSNHPYSVHQPLTGQSPEEFVETTKRRSCKSLIEFGVIPQMEDLLQEPKETSQELCDTTVIKDHFGALSEGGMAVNHQATKFQNPVETRMDTPFSKFGFQIISPPSYDATGSSEQVSSIDRQGGASVDDTQNQSDDPSTHDGSLQGPTKRVVTFSDSKSTEPRIKYGSNAFMPEIKRKSTSKPASESKPQQPRKGLRIKREVGRETEMIRRHDANSSVYGASLKHEQRMATIEYQELMQARKSVPWRAKYNEPREGYHEGRSGSAG